jgi:hypothetical protein
VAIESHCGIYRDFTFAFQPRRLTVSPTAAGCKRLFAGASQANESKGRKDYVEDGPRLGTTSHRPHVVLIVSKHEHGFLAHSRVTASRVKTTHNGVPSQPVPLAHRDYLGIRPHSEPATHHPFPSVEIEEVPGRHREKLTSFRTDVDRVDVEITLLHPVHEITWAKSNGTGCWVIRRYDGPAMSRAARNMVPEPACWTVRLRQLQTP